jgi:hypothetical protein
VVGVVEGQPVSTMQAIRSKKGKKRIRVMPRLYAQNTKGERLPPLALPWISASGLHPSSSPALLPVSGECSNSNVLPSNAFLWKPAKRRLCAALRCQLTARHR